MTGEVKLKPGERIDDLNRGGYRIIQDPSKFCFGMDAVLLAWFSRVEPHERALDLCSGNGAVMLLADARRPGAKWTGLEIQEESSDLAARSILLNGTEDRMTAVSGDLRGAAGRFGKASFDVITVNPPYKKAGSGLRNPSEAKAISRHEVLCTLEDVLREASGLLRDGGRFYMVHRPERITEILSGMLERKLAPKDVVFVHPFADKDATMVLVSGVKGGRNEAAVRPPIVIYEDKARYSAQYLKIYSE